MEKVMAKINARDCKLIEIEDQNIVKKFLEDNHRQGYASYAIAYALLFKDDIVQIMTFGNPRFSKAYQCEIIRDCTLKDHVVNGGVSKIWKHFIKNNKIHSCIVYSYPHDEEHLYTSKYVDYCGFNNISKAKPSKKVSFKGNWDGEKKSIDISLLYRYGVDYLLKGSFGHDRSNEEILLDLGFEKVVEDGYNPQIDAYFPFGVLYRIDDITDGSFYIGKSESKDSWDNGYLGSGTYWNRHCKAHPDHEYKRTVLKDDFISPVELYQAEVKEIRKYSTKNDRGIWNISDDKCKNIMTVAQGGYPHFINNSAPCPECGCVKSHLKTCSHYTEARACPECGRIRSHTTECSHYKAPKVCPECGVAKGHKADCSRNPKKGNCPECGNSLISNTHKSWCSHYKKKSKPKPCPECGSVFTHKSNCSKSRGFCEECGASLVSPHHKPGCSKYKPSKVCDECGGKNGRHYKTCSQYKKPKDSKRCEECGCSHGKHLNICSHSKGKCPHCGNSSQSNHHKPDCPLNKNNL